MSRVVALQATQLESAKARVAQLEVGGGGGGGDSSSSSVAVEHAEAAMHQLEADLDEACLGLMAQPAT